MKRQSVGKMVSMVEKAVSEVTPSVPILALPFIPAGEMRLC
jgi:hypothetical protein